MTHLKVENQNNNIEIVNAAIIQKLYNLALGIEQNLEVGESLSDYVSLKGNLQADHAYQNALTYLNNQTKFPDLQVSVPSGAEYIQVSDELFEKACIAKYGDGVGVIASQIRNITTLSDWYFSSRDSQTTNVIDVSKVSTIDISGFTNLLNIGASAFNGVTNIQNIILPPNLKRLSYNDGSGSFGGCFRGNNVLTTIQLPNGLEEIGDRCFMSCSNLTSIEFPQSLKYIGGSSSAQEWGVFYETGLTSITFPNGLLTIGDQCFSCTPITGTIIIPGSVNFLGERAFERNGGPCTFILENGDPIELVENLTPNHIPHNSFTSNRSGNAVIFKRNISSVGNHALMLYNDIKYVFKQTTPPTVEQGVEISFSWVTNGTIYVEDNYVETWKQAQGFSDFSNCIQPLSTAPFELRVLLSDDSELPS